MKRIKKYIACALSAAMIMSSGFAQGAVVSYAEETDVGIVATAGDAEEFEVEVESQVSQNQNVVTEELEVQRDSQVTALGLEYVETDYGVIITGYSGTTANVEIPSEIDGKKVTDIADGAFGCHTDIDTDEIVSNGVTSVVIPGSVTSIGNTAFLNCISLTSVTISDGVTSIGQRAFEGCSSLTSVNIPNSVISIDSSAFAGCSSLNSITVANDNKAYDSREDCNAIIDTNSKQLIAGCKNTVIPDGITGIAVNAFSGCTGLTSITIPNGVTSIKYGAFEKCTSLKSISMPDGLLSIGMAAFYDCSSLISITIPDSVTSIGDIAFADCSSAASINIPDSLTNVGYLTFAGCSALTSIIIPNSVTSIDELAFEGCNNITIICNKNSAAHLYAVENEIPFKLIGGDGALATGVVLNQSAATLGIETNSTLTATVTPDDAISKAVIWSSSDPKVATVDSNGKVTAVSAGTATITCKAIAGSGVTASCTVTVTGTTSSSNTENKVISVTGIKLNETTKTLVNGESTTLKPTVTPSDATNLTVTWNSSNTKVATVSDEGVVKAVGKGTATITCAASDGSGVTASCKITVTQPVTGVKLNTSSKTITNGKSVTLKSTISPADATNTDVTWKSSNTKVAKVDKNGKVMAVGKGKAKITCTTKDGSKTATCSITVKQLVTKIKLNKTKATIKKGKTLKLKATATPTNANNKKVKWKSSNTKVATVSSSGKVTARKKGTATITCTAADGSGKKVTCKITVK